MRKFALIPTRSEPTSNDVTAHNLKDYLVGAGWEVHWLIGEDSIFSAVKNKCTALKLVPDDIVIICHDDIEIFQDKKVFNHLIHNNLDSKTGFLGVAGTPSFGENQEHPCTWWAELPHSQMRGIVWHGDSLEECFATFFGTYGNAVVMDGVFLCTTGRVLNSIQLTQPKTFPGPWDFYDIFYTFQAYVNGLGNKVIPITIRHASMGNPRPEWDFNRHAFIQLFSKYLPAVVR